MTNFLSALLTFRPQKRDNAFRALPVCLVFEDEKVKGSDGKIGQTKEPYDLLCKHATHRGISRSKFMM